MDELLTPVSTTYLRPRKEPEPFLTEVKSTRLVEASGSSRSIASADEALDALKSQPDYDTLLSALRFLTKQKPSSDGFSLQSPGPKSAAIVHVLVSEIAPNYWTLLLEGSHDESVETEGSRSKDAELLLRCLRSVTGLNAITAQTRSMIQELRVGGKEGKRSDISLNLSTLVSLLAAVLGGDDFIHNIWRSSVGSLSNTAMQKAQSQQLISILTNGRLVSISAEALVVIGNQQARSEIRWIADGVEYVKWLGQNISTWAKLSPSGDGLKFCSDLFQRSISLSYSGMCLKLWYLHWLTPDRNPHQNCH